MFEPPKPHYKCFACLRRLGFGYDRTARHMGIRKIRVYAWFKYHGISIDRPQLVKRIWDKRTVNKNAKSYYKKKAAWEWELRYKRSKEKRKITCYLRSKIWQAFKLGLHVPSAQILLGCTIGEFKEHIGALLRTGMTMENYGAVWHLDHKIPCSKFDLSQFDQRQECFNFKNYQPLFAKENWSKHAKIDL